MVCSCQNLLPFCLNFEAINNITNMGLLPQSTWRSLCYLAEDVGIVRISLVCVFGAEKPDTQLVTAKMHCSGLNLKFILDAFFSHSTFN